MLDITQVSGIAMLYVQHIGQLVETLLSSLALIDDDGIVQVAAFDEIGLQQRLYVAYEDEGAGAGYLLGIVLRIIQACKLRVDELRLERAHGRNREILIGQDRDARTCILVLHLNFLTDDVEVLWSVLLLNAYLLDFFYILDGRTIEDGELRPVHLHDTVVDAQSIECRQCVFHCRDANLALAKHSAALSVNNVLCHSIDDGFAFQVNALNLVTSVLGCGVESNGQVQTCMQTFSKERKAAFQCILLHSM